MKNSVPVGRILAEGMVIVVSILLALSADAWWDRREERREEQGALSQLYEEFLQNRERLAEAESGHRAQRDNIINMLTAIAERGYPPGSYELPDSILRGGLGWVEFEPVGGVITSLISSGKIALIRDDSLRVALASWLEEVRQLQVDEVQDGDLRLQVRDVVHDYVPLVSVDYRLGSEGVATPSRFDADYRGLLDSRDFENLLNFRRAKKNNILTLTGEDGYGTLKELLEWILSRLRTQLVERG
jgi:hypothetical protein